MNFEEKIFGYLEGGEEVKSFEIFNGKRMKVVILNYGCIVQSIQILDDSLKWIDVVLGYDTVEEYLTNDGYLGAVIGRVGNRIKKGRFEIDNKEYFLEINDPPNHLHGGISGFDSFIWNTIVDGNKVILNKI